jgi:hypothetical protein
MMFVCYVLAFGILGFAYEWPDVFLLLVMVLSARFVIR